MNKELKRLFREYEDICEDIENCLDKGSLNDLEMSKESLKDLIIEKLEELE